MKDFTTGKIAKPLLLFSLPMLVGNIFQQLYSLVDMMIVGRFIGGQSLAAVGVSMYVTMFVVSIIMGLTMGASVVISQFYGAKQYDKLKTAVSVSIIMFFCLSIILSVLGTLFAPSILRLLNVGHDIFNEAQNYMRIIMAGMIFQAFYNMYTSYMRALGDSVRPLYFLICTTLLNIVLDFYFVLGLGMGVEGTALATIISQAVSMLLCIIYAYRRMPLLQVKKLVFDSALFKLILKFGTPAALQMSFGMLAQLTITRLINSFGSITMAAISTANRIDIFAMMPLQNLGMAMSTFVAQNMGAGKEERAKRGFRITLVYSLVCALAMTAVILLLSKQILSLFLSPNDVNAAEILRIGSMYLSIMVMFYFLMAFFNGFMGFFRGAGDAKMAMALTISSLTIRAIAAYCFVGIFRMGPEAFAWSIPLGWGLCNLGSLIYYKKRLWAGKTAVKVNTNVTIGQ